MKLKHQLTVRRTVVLTSILALVLTLAPALATLPITAAMAVTSPVSAKQPNPKIPLGSVTTPVPSLGAKSYILMEAGSGKVLAGSNIHQKRPQASTTKITTAIVALQLGKPEAKVLISKHADDTPEEGLWLEPGEQFTLQQMLYALMLFSANDAATAISEHIGAQGMPSGTTPEQAEEHFVSLMNTRAAAIGARDTHYANPHGLDDPEHYSSAYDLALLARYGLLKVPGFAGLVSTIKQELPWVGHPYSRVLRNRNKLLTSYPGANGVKTGFTDRAGRCLVSSARRGELQLIAVVMDSPDIFKESASLLDWGYANYQNVKVTDKTSQYGTIKVTAGLKESSTVYPAQSLTFPVPGKLADGVRIVP
ncbi:MAG TPA: D-alanyl-D-alanine carboxypeptidase family protein, partial [Bacillota bacterium]|nr:D-alanyl-D-alanine carboxypeptidase family protein [Bacillota bacterium]